MVKEKIYAEIPDFDQETEYVVQLPPVETDGEIFYGVKVLTIPPDEENKALVDGFMP